MLEDFDLLSEIIEISPIARGLGVDIRHYLDRKYANGRRVRWRKLKGYAWIRLHDTHEVQYAELHWYEGHGVGRRDMKRKYKLRGE